MPHYAFRDVVVVWFVCQVVSVAWFYFDNDLPWWIVAGPTLLLAIPAATGLFLLKLYEVLCCRSLTSASHPDRYRVHPVVFELPPRSPNCPGIRYGRQMAAFQSLDSNNPNRSAQAV